MSLEPGKSAKLPKKTWPPALWVSSTYFAEGFPYAVINNLVEILFKDMGASLRVVGLTSLFHLPWNLKFSWGPFVDQYETKKRWLLFVEVALSVMLLLVALFVGTFSGISIALVASVALLAFLSATHDIAIDAFYLEALDEQQQSAFVGYRATFYRIAAIFVVGPLLMLCDQIGWGLGFAAIAVLMGAITVYHFWALPDVEQRRQPFAELAKTIIRPRILWVTAVLCTAFLITAFVPQVGQAFRYLKLGVALLPGLGGLGLSDWVVLVLFCGLLLGAVLGKKRFSSKTREDSHYSQSFRSFMSQERAGIVLAFVVLFRTGESFLMKMRWPFLTDIIHMTKAEYGFYNGVIGVAASFGTTLVGGWLISRHGLRSWIWPFVVAQNALNLLYMWVGAVDDPATLSRLTLAAVIAIEHAGAGLGTAVFMVFLMRACDPAHKAGHMAILTALMSVSFTIAGVFSGYLAEALGFSMYFGLTFLATVPSMLLIPFLPHLDGRTSAAVPEE